MAVRAFAREDIGALRNILVESGVFRKEEIEVAVELMEIVIEEPEQQDYLMFTSADEHDRVQGYYCVGPTPMTETSFDLYWIAVDPALRGSGVSRELMEHCLNMVATRKGTKIIAETSSLSSYDRARAFYQKHGFREEARIHDYYASGDDLIIYTKQLSGGTIH